MTLANEKGWKILLPGLVSEARTQATNEAASQGGRPDKFDKHTFQKCLVNFIVADDQVCSDLFMFPRLIFLSSDSPVIKSGGM